MSGGGDVIARPSKVLSGLQKLSPFPALSCSALTTWRKHHITRCSVLTSTVITFLAYIIFAVGLLQRFQLICNQIYSMSIQVSAELFYKRKIYTRNYETLHFST